MLSLAPQARRHRRHKFAILLAIVLCSACALHASLETTITSQRSDINAATIIATDNIDDLTLGNLADALKHMPGISFAYTETKATGVRIDGLNPIYTSFSLDGIAISTNARTVDLSNLTATGIESIEFIQTLTASMDASAAAGRINLVTKDPFTRTGPRFRFQFGLDANSKAMRLGRSCLPDDRKHSTLDLGGHFNYGDLFLDRRLAIELNISRYGAYDLNREQTTTYTYRNSDPSINPGFDPADLPTIYSLSWRPSHRLTETFAANFNLGYKITPNLTFSLRSAYSHEQRRTCIPRTTLQANDSESSSPAPGPAVDPASNLTYWNVVVVAPRSLDSRLINAYTQNNYSSNLKTLSSRLSYKHNNLAIDLNAGYAGHLDSLRDTEDGFFRSSSAILYGLGWTATRPSPGSQNWTVVQTGGPVWTNPTGWRPSTSSITSRPERSRNEQYTAGLDLTHASTPLGIPITLKAGAAIRRNDYEYHSENNSHTFIAPADSQIGLYGIPTTQNYSYHVPLGNDADQWRTHDTRALYDLFLAHPDWFTSSTVANLRNKLTGARDLSEEVSAAYVELNGHHNRLRFNLGLRMEHSKTTAKLNRMRTQTEIAVAQAAATPDEIASGKFDTNTVAGTLFQCYNGQRFPRTNPYTNFFLSGGLAYDITPALQARFSASQSILRPDYAALAGPVTYGGNTMLIPNPTLKPERITKYHADLHWRIDPASTLSLSVHRMELTDIQIGYIQISRQAAENILGYSISPPFPEGGFIIDDTNFHTILNASEQLAIHGLTLAYDQQLTFLPSALKGIALFGSLTLSSISNTRLFENLTGQVKRSANAGIRYHLGRLSLHLCGAWTDTFLQSITHPSPSSRYYLNDRQYEKARLVIDLTGGFRITKYLEIALSVRNLANAPRIWYSGTPDRLSRHTVGGSLWNLSLKGIF